MNAQIPRRTAQAVIVVAVLSCTASLQAKKPDNPGGGGGGGDIESSPYSLIDLLGLPGGPSGGFQGDAVKVSDRDAAGGVWAVGETFAQGEFRPALWSVSEDKSFTVEELGSAAEAIATRASDVNDSGVITVNAILQGGPVEELPLVLVPGMPPQPLQMAGSVAAYARGINNLGTIVGYLVYDDGSDRWAAGALWQLDGTGKPASPVPLGDFLPKDISDTGLMIGRFDSVRIAATACFDSNNVLHVQSLGTLFGHSLSEAHGVSSDGTWVVGHSEGYDSEGNYSCEAFRWSTDTAMIGLGRLGGSSSVAYSVNDQGHAVGYSDTGGGKYSWAAVLWRDRQLTDLNGLIDSKGYLPVAKGINNSGDIVGILRLSRPVSEEHAYLLRSNP